MPNEFLHSVPDTTTHLTIVEALFGQDLPADNRARSQLVHRLAQTGHRLEIWSIQPVVLPGLRWSLTVLWPECTAPCPVLLSPDGCWPHVLGTQAQHSVLRAGVALAWFDRTALAFDAPDAQRAGPLFTHCPHGSFGAVAAWAWGLQCTADAMLSWRQPQAMGVSVIGHSRGGKAALLAAARHPGIQAVIAHNSGTGGAASLRVQGPGSETLAMLCERFPHWMGSQVALPEVQRLCCENDATYRLLQTLAPRGLCLLQADDDVWANPLGTAHMAHQLQADLSQRPQALRHQTRLGGHAMTPLDWQRAADFVRTVSDVGGEVRQAHGRSSADPAGASRQ